MLKSIFGTVKGGYRSRITKPAPKKKPDRALTDMEKLAKEIDDLRLVAAETREERRNRAGMRPVGSCFVTEEGNGGGWPVYSQVISTDSERNKAVQFYWDCGEKQEWGKPASIFTREGPISNNPHLPGSGYPIREISQTEFQESLKKFKDRVSYYVGLAKGTAK